MEVDLNTIDCFHNFSIREFLISVNHIQPLSIMEELKGKTKNSSIAASASAPEIKPIKLPLNEPVNIQVRRIVSPNEIYATLGENELDVMVLEREIAQFYSTGKNGFTLMKPGMYFACELKSDWHRAKVLMPPDVEGLVLVQFIDYGESAMVPWYALHELDLQFYNFSCYAAKISLAYIEPICDDTWTEEAKEFLTSHLIDCEGEVFIVSVGDAGVMMKIQYDGLDINVNKSMVHFKHAKPLDELPSEIPFHSTASSNTLENLNEHQNYLHAIKIIEIDIFHPQKFCFKFIDNSVSVDIINKLLQSWMKVNRTHLKRWEIGQPCVVYHTLTGDCTDSIFLRGNISSVTDRREFIIDLMDHWLKVKTKLKQLYVCPPEFSTIGKTYAAGYLSCRPMEDKWKTGVIEAIRKIVKSYEIFYVTFKDTNVVQFRQSNMVRPVILWARELSEFAPTINIINKLEENGLVTSKFAEKDFIPSLAAEVAKIFEENEVQESLQLCLPHYLDGSTDKVGSYAVSFKKIRIKQWLPAVPITKSSFIGLITNVDEFGNMDLIDAANEDILNSIKKIINNYFNETPLTAQQFHADDPCLVRFENDNLYYRGRIVKIDIRKCSVQFIDYGNIQKKVRVKDLHADTICSEVPILSQKYRLLDKPDDGNGNIDQNLLDKLHAAVVEKRADIRVIPEDIDRNDQNYVKRCWVTVEGRTFKSFNDV